MVVNLLDKRVFHIFITIDEIFRHIKQSAKKNLIKKILTILLGLNFISNNILKSKSMEAIIKKYCLIISKNGKVLRQL